MPQTTKPSHAQSDATRGHTLTNKMNQHQNTPIDFHNLAKPSQPRESQPRGNRLNFRKYPSTAALQCFESAARHLSFTRAAKELHMTQSAVSKQVAQLEEMLKIELFLRGAQGIVLTPAGRSYYKDALTILQNIELATISIMAHGDDVDVLKMCAQPTFCARWLIPALKGFGQRYPHIHLDIAEHVGHFDAAGDIEIAFLYGDGVWPNMTSVKLFNECRVAVCAPDYLPTPITHAKELARHTLIQLASDPAMWYHFFEAVDELPDNSFLGPRFGTYYACISAAVSGCGIALVPRELISNELNNGDLVLACPHSLVTDKAYYMAHVTELGSSKRILAMREWIQDYLAHTHPEHNSSS